MVDPDTCGDVEAGYETKAADDWKRTASRLHSNLDFRLNSQSLAMYLTPEKCLGGRAWPNIILHESDHAIPLLLWCNSTLGLILFWWRGTRQHAGRSVLTVSTLPGLPVLDPRTLKRGQVDHCRELFHELKSRKLRPANEAYRDAHVAKPSTASCCSGSPAS